MEKSTDLERRCQNLEALHELACELLQIEDYDQVLDTLVQRALSVLEADRGFLVLQRGEALDFKVVRNWNREELESDSDPISQTLVSDVLQRREILHVEDALSDPRFGQVRSVLELKIRSVLAAPLEVDGRTVGALYLESRSLKHFFGERELELFQRILSLSSRVLQSCTRRLFLEQRNDLLLRNLLARHNFSGIVTRDEAFLRILETVAQVATTDMPVLIQGPSGTGKELVARAVHQNSSRSGRPFRVINCGAIAPNLLESELFGHTRGAFTGAGRDHPGLIPSAHTGTVFLDEIGELPRELQVKLLRTLQFGEVQPVGSAQARKVDVRFLAATNRDLEAEIQKGRFREDLLYRINAITLELPPLRERPGDVLLLFYHFLDREAERTGRPMPEVTPALERTLQQHSWPGNVRELENETMRLLALTPWGEPLTVGRLSRRTRDEDGSLADVKTLAEQEKELIELHLRRCDGNRTHAAKSLGISRDGLRRKMKRFNLS